MLKLFTNNLLAKILSLVLALGFWVYVVSGEAKVDNFPGSIPIDVINKQSNLVAVRDINEINIRITAEKATWSKLSSSSFSASIDLAGLGEGTYEVPIKVTSNELGVQVIEVKPSKIMVSMEQIATKSVPIKEKFDGVTASGMLAKNAKFNVDSAIASGPKSIIERLDQATAITLLDGEDSTFSRNITLSALNEKGEKYSNVSFDPINVDAQINIIKAAQTKSVGVKVNTDGKVAGGYWVSQINTDPLTATITGSANELNNINYLETQPINIEALSRDKTTQTSLILPNSITLMDNLNNKVTVEVKISSLDLTKDFISGFSFQNLPNSLKITKIDPEVVNLILSGSADKLSLITNTNTKVNLDVSSYSQAGTYVIDLKDTNIIRPDGISVINFMPSSIKITLENK
jgi:YbbR domain-containing protein